MSTFDIDEVVEGEPEGNTDTDSGSDTFEVEELSDEVPTDQPAAASTSKKDEEPDNTDYMFDASPRPRGPKGESKPKGESTPRVEIPEGWCTPTQLVHVLKDRAIVKLKPQAMYGFVKTGKGFPWKYHVDGRYIVPIEDEAAQAAGETLANGASEIGAVSWVIKHYERRAQRDAEKAAKAAAQLEASTDSNSDAQPQVEGESETVDFQS